MYSIGIVIPYFGKKPDFYDMWEISALANPSIDFYIFTDIKEIQSKSNIKVVCMSFLEMKNEIQKIFDFPICLESPYKLCDYKPTYGSALSKWIGGYDFWGYCDLDMLFGNLRKFFSDKVLSRVDRCYVNAHISLWRNSEKMNNMFKFQEDSRGLNYQDVYTSPDSYYFDEQRGVYTKCLLNGVRFSKKAPMRDPIQGEPYFYWGGGKQGKSICHTLATR